MKSIKIIEKRIQTLSNYNKRINDDITKIRNNKLQKFMLSNRSKIEIQEAENEISELVKEIDIHELLIQELTSLKDFIVEGLNDSNEYYIGLSNE